jgi:hypothetical protein
MLRKPVGPAVPRPKGHVGASGSLTLTLTIAGLALLPWAGLAGQARETYDTAMVDPSGHLHIRTTDRRAIQAPQDPEQVGFDQIAISPDRHAVGWLALFPNCCTSYPIPLKLVVCLSGRMHTFVGTGLPVWKWRFDSTSQRVAFYQETVHGGLGEHYELRDIATGRLVAQYEPLDSGPPPPWVRPLADP